MEQAFFSFLLLAGAGLLLTTIVMTLVWWRQLYTRNAGIVDAWWSYNFGFLAILYFFLRNDTTITRLIIVIMVVIWSARLGTYLLIRNSSHTTEDSRYRKLREEYGSREKFLMWRFFLYQAISNVLLSLPFLLALNQTPEKLSLWFYAGAILWFTALIGESVADYQLKRFKSISTNQGKVCQQGLWYYSRHPNYFFEWLIWVAFALIATEVTGGWLGWLSPIIMYYILNNVTGIPMLEELALKTKGEAYRHYQQSTSAFFPWFKK